MEKHDDYVQVLMGTTYELGRPQNIGELRELLEQIAADLPRDANLRLSEATMHDGRLSYMLEQGIPQ